MSHQTKHEVLTDLRDRMYRAADSLDGRAIQASSSSEVARLGAKAEGVRLALSFVEEALRD